MSEVTEARARLYEALMDWKSAGGDLRDVLAAIDDFIDAKIAAHQETP